MRHYYRNSRRGHFNPRPRKEGDPCLSNCGSKVTLFQSTPSQRGRRRKLLLLQDRPLFQSTPSQRGRQAVQRHCILRLTFQSTPSQRGRRMILVILICHLKFQSTPSQRGRRTFKSCTKVAVQISIHALAKRATIGLIFAPFGTSISIHALAKRATRCDKCYFLWDKFQSTPSQRGRRIYCCIYIIKRNFNPRPRKEGDLFLDKIATACIEFQSTPSQRGRHGDFMDSFLFFQFQSTPSQRGRQTE